jgi:outer membrane protein TolC
MNTGTLRHRFRAGALTTLAVALVVASNPATAQTETPPGATAESLLEYARRQNLDYAAMRFDAVAAGERVGPAGALPDPTLRTELQNIGNSGSDAGPNLLPGRIGSTKYTLIQPLPWWGKRDLRREVAESEASQAGARAEVTWADIALRIKAAHAQHYQLTRNEQLTQEILDLLTGIERIAQTRYGAGLVPQQEVLRAQIEVTALRTDLVMLETDHHHLQARINTLLRRPINASLMPPLRLRPLPPPEKLDFAALEQRLLAKNSQLFVAKAGIAAAEKNRDLTYRDRYPDFSVGIAPIQRGSRVDEWELMLELNIPLQQGSRRSREREAEAQLDAARARREAAQTQLLGELSESLTGIEAALRLRDLAQSRMLPQAEISYRSALSAYENGRGDFATLLEAQRQIKKARLDVVKAETDAQVRLAEIERLLGEDL